MPLAGQQIHQRCVHPGPLVLGTNPLNSPTPTADRDRTVSRRSEPSSRTALMGEQPNPWDLLQRPDSRSTVRDPIHQGWYLKVASTPAAAGASKAPTYPERDASNPNTRL